MSNKLFIGSLAWETTEDELKNAFSKAGTVMSVNIIIDRATSRSKGFGFIEMSSEEESEVAIEMWNNKDFNGRTLTVNKARPMEDRPPRKF